VRLYKVLVRPVLDLGKCIASPGYKSGAQFLEGVQRRVTKAVSKRRDKPYDKCLKELMTNKLSSQETPQFNCQFPKILALTRGDIQRLFKPSTKT
jgi:hypothetical protein